MRHIIFPFVFLVLLFQNAFSQNTNPVSEDLIKTLQPFENHIKSSNSYSYNLLEEIYSKNPTITFPSENISPQYKDSLLPYYSSLIGKNEYQYHSFIFQNRKGLSVSWVNHYYFMPIIDSIRSGYNVPKNASDLIYAASFFQKKYSTDLGHKGWWSLPLHVANKHQLINTSYIDDRFNLIESSKAAFSYLEDLYAIYQNWDFAYLAFIVGPERLNKKTALSGVSLSVDSLHLILEYESSLIPFSIYMGSLFDAIPLEINYHYLDAMAFSSTPVEQSVYLDQISNYLQIDLEKLKELNGRYKQGYIPALSDQVKINLPKEIIDTFHFSFESIMNFERSNYFAATDTNFYPMGNPKISSYPGKKLIYYKVRRGDYLGRIAKKYKVRVRDIQKWNRLRGTKIREGQRLKIYIR